jgi:TonB family protein
MRKLWCKFFACIFLQAGIVHAEGLTVKRLVGIEYPVIAAQAQIQGRVVLECTIANDGTVENVGVLSGHPILSKAAKINIEKWRFSVPDAKPKRFRIAHFTYEFSLEGVCTAPNCSTEFEFEAPAIVRVRTQARHWVPGQSAKAQVP